MGGLPRRGVKRSGQGNRMNDAVVFSSPFKGEAGRGMGFDDVVCCPPPCLLLPHPHPNPPLEGEGASFMRLPWRSGLLRYKSAHDA